MNFSKFYFDPKIFEKFGEYPMRWPAIPLGEQGKLVLEQDTWHPRVGSWNYDVIIPNRDDVIIMMSS